MKIEEKIEKLQNELNEIKNELKKEAAEFTLKVGDWFVPHKPKNTYKYPAWSPSIDKYDNVPLEIARISSKGNYVPKLNEYYYFNPSWCEKWEPKKGDYCYVETNKKWIIIFKEEDNRKVYSFGAYAFATGNIYVQMENALCDISKIKSISPTTPEQIRLLDSKLAEQGLRFNKETLEIEKISKYKEPIIGELAIFWDKYKEFAIIGLYKGKKNEKFSAYNCSEWENAILYESPEQYKQFIKEANEEI